jgi:hypothetical protein
MGLSVPCAGAAPRTASAIREAMSRIRGGAALSDALMLFGLAGDLA